MAVGYMYQTVKKYSLCRLSCIILTFQYDVYISTMTESENFKFPVTNTAGTVPSQHATYQ